MPSSREHSFSTERQAFMAEHAAKSPREQLELAKKIWPKTNLQSIYQMRNHMRKLGVNIPRLGNARVDHPERYPNGMADGAQPMTGKRGHRPKSPTTLFVLGLPMDMPAAEAAQRATKAGFEVNRNRVNQIRLRHSPALRKSQPAQTTQAGKPSKPGKRHRAVSPATLFVLQQSADLSAAEVAALAKKAGHDLDRNAVNGIRYRHRDRPVPPAPASTQLALPETQAEQPLGPVRKARKGHAEAVVLPLGNLSTDEADFMGLVLGIGYNRAARLLAQFRQQFFGMLKSHTTDPDN
jgi:hypothetical protein